MTFVAPVPPAVDGPLTGPDRPMLEAYLDWQRRTLLNICAGLDESRLAARPLPSSNLSLLGLVQHLAKVERIWFRIRAGSENIPTLYEGNDDFDVLGAAPSVFAQYEDECAAAVAVASRLDFDAEVDVHGETFSLRMIYLHMIGEYARHNGHADLLREAIDGVTAR